MTTSPPESYISEEEALRRTNREAFLIGGGGLLFLCAPTLLCFPQYREAALILGVSVLGTASSLITLLIILRVVGALTVFDLRKRKDRFLSAEELATAKDEERRTSRSQGVLQETSVSVYQSATPTEVDRGSII